VNIFIVFFLIFSCPIGFISVIINIIIINLFFFVLLVSFELKDAVYINSVIIPEENVRIITNEIQLLIVLLNAIFVDIKDNIRMIIDIYIGFMFFIILLEIKIIIIDIFPLYFMIYKIIVFCNF